MQQNIRLQNIYCADLYTRSRALELRSFINEKADTITLDFEGIGFMSRSFADEVCNIIDDMKEKSFLFTNQNEDVKNMLMKVQESRSRERKRGNGNAKLYEFKDMESLSNFLLTM